ncbi:MAG: thioesterase family protein [Gammaproteobacteria bacterium]|jgi:acyl-CoA thioester hydrolase|nr:thioesterase family protein [Gammaproteobacteria bacterium]MDX2461938.1 thioesterase family protein [Gammaproteobacteria bacterium]
MNKDEAAPMRDSYLHFSTISTRWADNDVYHHVNNALYYNFFDTVIAGYLVNEGGFEFSTSEIIGLAVESGCRYRRPLAFPQEIHMGLRVAHLGNSSVRYEVGVFDADNRQAAADGYFVHVFVSRATNKATPIPARLRTALARLQSA